MTQRDQALLKSRGLLTHRSLPLAYKDLAVRGQGSIGEIAYAPTVGAIIAPWTNRKYKKKTKKLAAARADLEEKQTGVAQQNGQDEDLKKGERYLLKDFNGLVKAGEMMLVVGRPGSGCTTFLKTLAGLHNGYAGVDGDIMYGNMKSGKDLKAYRSDVIFNSEEDIHDANLLVGRTLDFAIRMNTPSPAARIPGEEGGEAISADEYRNKTKGELLKMFGLEHTHDTKVGDQYVRGVSGEYTNVSFSTDAADFVDRW